MTLGQSQVNLLPVRTFAKVCRTTPRTLRFYERLGLFKPFKVDPINNYRYYKPNQARTFLKIKLLQSFHIPLTKIAAISRNAPGHFLEQKVGERYLEIKNIEKEIAFLKRIKRFLFDEITPKKLLNQQVFGPYVLFCVLYKNGRYDRITQYIIDLQKTAEKYGIRYEKHHQITFYLSGEYNTKSTPLEIALIYSGERPSDSYNGLPPNHYFRAFPSTKTLTYTYIGPYAYLTFIYQKITEYFNKEKINITGRVFEKYGTGPLNGSYSPFEYTTYVAYPIR